MNRPCAAYPMQAFVEGKPGLLQELAEDFQKKTDLIIHDKCDPIVNLPAEKASLCCLLGFCVCKGKGLQAQRFHNNLTTYLKQQFTPMRKRKGKAPLTGDALVKQNKLKANREMMDDGFIVIKIYLQHERSSDLMEVPLSSIDSIGSGWASLLADDATNDVVEEVWFHLGFVNYSTWQISLLRLEEDTMTRIPGFIKLMLPEEQSLSSAVKLSPAHFQDLIDFDSRWSCKVYCILENDDALPLVTRPRKKQFRC